MSFLPHNMDVEEFTMQQDQRSDENSASNHSHFSLESRQILTSVPQPEEMDNPPLSVFQKDFPMFGEFTIEKVLEVIGEGTYQKSIIMASILCLFGSAFISFCLSFFATEPLFKCE